MTEIFGLDMVVSLLLVGAVEGICLPNLDLSVNTVDLSLSVSPTPSPRGSL